MSYHDATYRLLGEAPVESPPALRRLGEAEKRLGRPLPASLRQWYGRKGALRILLEHSNDDPPVDIDRFTSILWRNKTLLPIRHENQGVCTWAVELNSCDDPAVYVDVDSDGANWQLAAETFSDYVHACVWDHACVLKQPALVQAQNQKLSDRAKEALPMLLTSVGHTKGWPGQVQYRFQGDVFSVLIWEGDQHADWFLGAADEKGLQRGLNAIADIDGVGRKFYGCSDLASKVLSLQNSGR